MPLKPWLAKVVNGGDLDEGEMAAGMSLIMDGRGTPAQVGGLLVALRMKGEVVDEIAGAARAMRERVAQVHHTLPRVLDTCGTGGDRSGSFNISTAVGLVCAGAGVPVAKHGNRSVTSRCGSADVLEALGVGIELPHERIAECLREVGFAFMFAPFHHPAMRHLAGPRKELGLRTVMNLLGPLTNPARATHQLVGIYDGGRVRDVAEVLGRLGVRRAVVVHGEDGMDEVSPCGPTRVAEVMDGAVRTLTTRPEDAGLEPVRAEALRGGDAATNAGIIREVLGGAKGGPRTAVVLNAGWALYAAEAAPTPAAGVGLAEAAIDTGRAQAVLARLVDYTAR